jgi:hypothetical protein
MRSPNGPPMEDIGPPQLKFLFQNLPNTNESNTKFIKLQQKIAVLMRKHDLLRQEATKTMEAQSKTEARTR